MLSNIFILSILTLACGEKGSENATDDTAQDSLFNNTDPNEEVDSNAPTISSADAWCFIPGGSVEGEQWGFTFQFTDPQGVESVPRLQPGAIQILNGSGTATNSIDPACSWDDGSCSAFPFSTQVGTGCDGATTISAQFQIVDEDGNTSNTITLTGRVGENFEG